MSLIQKIEPKLKHYIWGTEAWYELFPDCPVLIKVIDANEPLSVQVHPDDAYACLHENQSGKTEMWYIADAEKDAGIYCGFNRQLTKAGLLEKIQNHTLTDALNFIKVRCGDTFLIDAGTVHAIGKDVKLIEVQQNSNVTYRLYDYGRVDANGKTRELHIDKALDVVCLEPVKVEKVCAVREYPRVVADCAYFCVTEYMIEFPTEILCNATYNALTIIGGSGIIAHNEVEVPYAEGETFFIPQSTVGVRIVPSQKTVFLYTTG